jgi:ABC-2 type transport system permease protein
MVLSIITIFCLVPAIVALAVGLGAVYPDFKSENPALSVTSFDGLLFMLFCFGLIAAVIMLEAGPVYYAFMADVQGKNLSALQIVWLIASFALALLLCLAAIFYLMRLGEKHLLTKLILHCYINMIRSFKWKLFYKLKMKIVLILLVG